MLSQNPRTHIATPPVPSKARPHHTNASFIIARAQSRGAGSSLLQPTRHLRARSDMQRRATSAPLLLLRRWRAWQLEHHHQQQQVIPAAAAFAAAAAAAAAPPSTTTTTTTHAATVSRVAATLERLGVRPGLGAEVCDGLMTVDIACLVNGGAGQTTKVAVDVTPRDADPDEDGHQDSASTGRPRSAPSPQRAWALAQARRHALQAHGWHYVQLPIVEFAAATLGDAAAEEAIVRERVVEAAKAAAAQHVCGSGCSH
jgi:hypothetical protein